MAVEKTLWRGKSASLYVMQYLDACEMNDPFAIADAIERAFPRDYLLDLIVWYRTHIASDGVECPVNLLHVVLSRPQSSMQMSVLALRIGKDYLTQCGVPGNGNC